jgi:4-hydroxy-tetrahydrodipicolinate reductase
MTNSILNIIVLGAMGRMGQMVLSACLRDPKLAVTGAVEAPATPFIGQETGIKGIQVKVTDDLASVAEPGSVIIDFTMPEVTLKAVETAVKSKAKMIIGSTGLSDKEKEKIISASAEVPIVYSPNMSMGVNLLFKLTEMVTASLGEGFDVEIVEAHHCHKKDAPSGTALRLGEAVASGRSVDLKGIARYGREGIIGERKQGEIGIHAVRGGDIVGDHTVLFAGEGERIELRHMAHSRMTFAMGALKAARFLEKKESGFYTMFDVLGIA